MRAIHAASLRILHETGVRVANHDARARFERAGALVDGERVRLSPALVEDGLASVPRRVRLASRDGKNDLLLAGKRVHFGTGGSPGTVLARGTLQARPALLQDVADLAILAQALSEVDFYVLPITPSDVAVDAIAVGRFYAALRRTTKHIMGGLISLNGARAVHELACLIAGGAEALRERPFVSCMTSWMVSPLTFDTEVTDILTYWCEQGLPVALSAAPMAGSTSPITLAGTLTQLNAEQVAGMVYTQIVRKGTPVLAGYIPGQMNVQTGGYLGGTPEFALMQAAAAQLAQFYGAPLYCSANMTDSKTLDQQAGYEKMLTLLPTAMAGASYIHHAAGMVENMNAVSYEQMVLDNDIILMVKRVLRGIEVDEDALAVAAIQRAGPSGHYLDDEHTIRHLRREFCFPRLSDRQNRSAWEMSGGADVVRRATAAVEEMLAQRPASLLAAPMDMAIRTRFHDHVGTYRGEL